MSRAKHLLRLLSGAHVRAVEKDALKGLRHYQNMDVSRGIRTLKAKMPEGARLPPSPRGTPTPAERLDDFFARFRQDLNRVESGLNKDIAVPEQLPSLVKARREQALARGGAGALALAVLGAGGLSTYDAGVEHGRATAAWEKTAMIKTARIHYSHLLDSYDDGEDYGMMFLAPFKGSPYLAEAQKLHQKCKQHDAVDADHEVLMERFRVEEQIHRLKCVELEAALLKWRAEQEGTVLSKTAMAEKLAGRGIAVCGAGRSKEWCEHFNGTPLYKKALQLDVEGHALEAKGSKLRGKNRWELRRTIDAEKEALTAKLKAWKITQIDSAFEKQAGIKVAGLYLDPVLPRKCRGGGEKVVEERNYGPEAWLRDFEAHPDLLPVAKAVYAKSQTLKARKAVERAENAVWEAKAKMLEAEILKRHHLAKKTEKTASAMSLLITQHTLDGLDAELEKITYGLHDEALRKIGAAKKTKKERENIQKGRAIGLGVGTFEGIRHARKFHQHAQSPEYRAGIVETYRDTSRGMKMDKAQRKALKKSLRRLPKKMQALALAGNVALGTAAGGGVARIYNKHKQGSEKIGGVPAAVRAGGGGAVGRLMRQANAGGRLHGAMGAGPDVLGARASGNTAKRALEKKLGTPWGEGARRAHKKKDVWMKPKGGKLSSPFQHGTPAGTTKKLDAREARLEQLRRRNPRYALEQSKKQVKK